MSEQMICEVPTRYHKNGRTGTTAGYNAHWVLGEKACPDCSDAMKQKSTSWREKNREKDAEMKFRSKHGITLSDYEQMVISQAGVCAICKEPPGQGKKLYIDHDHNCCSGQRSCSKCVRGLLCHHCNVALGHFRDRPERLMAAVDYLAKKLLKEV